MLPPSLQFLVQINDQTYNNLESNPSSHSFFSGFLQPLISPEKTKVCSERPPLLLALAKAMQVSITPCVSETQTQRLPTVGKEQGECAPTLLCPLKVFPFPGDKPKSQSLYKNHSMTFQPSLW